MHHLSRETHPYESLTAKESAEVRGLAVKQLEVPGLSIDVPSWASITFWVGFK